MEVVFDGLEGNVIVQLCELKLELGVEIRLVRHDGTCAVLQLRLSASIHAGCQHRNVCWGMLIQVNGEEMAELSSCLMSRQSVGSQ